MKKIISFLIVVTVLASMCIMAVPASAATGSISMPSVVTTDADGNFSFKVTVSGATNYDSWLAVYNKELLEMNKKADGTYDFDMAGHFGRMFTQPCSDTNGADLKKDYVTPDGTEITFSNETIQWRNHQALYNGEYTMYLFRDFGDEYVILAQADFTVTGGYQIFTKSGMRLCMTNDPNGTEEMLWISQSDACHYTSFSASGEFDALGFTAWSSSITDEELKNDIDWTFQILDYSTEEVLVETTRKVQQDKFVSWKFDEPIPAGEYLFKVMPSDNYDSSVDANGNPEYYVVFPVSEVLPGSDSFTTAENCAGNGALLLEDGSSVGFGIHLTGKGVVSPAETDEPADETEAPADETEAPADETEVPSDETEAPADETEAPEANVGATQAPAATAGAGDKSADDEGGLSTGAIIGIIVAAVVVVAGAGVALYFFVFKKKK